MGGSVVPSRRGRHQAQASSRSARQPGPPSPISKNGHSTGATRRARRCLREPASPAMTGASYASNTPACYDRLRRLSGHRGGQRPRPASGGCSPTAATLTSAIPGSTAPRWRKPRWVTAPGTARSKLSSGSSPRIRHIPPAPEPKHPTRPEAATTPGSPARTLQKSRSASAGARRSPFVCVSELERSDAPLPGHIGGYSRPRSPGPIA